MNSTNPNPSVTDLASLIDHTLLNPIATPPLVERYCLEADRYGFAAVCFYPTHVRLATELLHDRKPKVCAVIGFPSGAGTSTTKLYEAQEAVENGATELDVVLNLGWLKIGNNKAVYEEIARICEETGQTVKAILETALLSNEEKQRACEICLDAGARFVKTSTGMFDGATVADVRLLKEVTSGHLEVKASGNIRTYDRAIALVEAGATRLGTSYGVSLLEQQEKASEKTESPSQFG